MSESREDPRPETFRAFEAFGYAMACAGTLEVMLRLILLERRVKETVRMDPERAEIAKQRFIKSTLFGSTFGALAQRVGDQHKLPGWLRKELTTAKESRDRLAHQFWQTHLPCMSSTEGIDLIAAECNLIADHFERVSRELQLATGVDLPSYTADFAERAARLLANHPLRDLLGSDG